MSFLILTAAMVLVGLLVGYIAGFIWKDNRPIGVQGDYLAAVITTVVVGLMDWFVIPALGFSDFIRNLGVIFEPALGALLVLWIIRKAKQ
jgi:uncharacterized membrane protein YeaQ/YmgE (transglycosylase-associated protein family)